MFLDTKLGLILGEHKDLTPSGYVGFQSIPYADAPLGEKRFMPANIKR